MSKEYEKRIAEALAPLGGAGLTFSRVVIEQAAEGYASLKVGATGKYCRLHALVGTMGTAAGTVVIQSSTDISGADTGAGQVALSGVMPIGVNGGVVIPFTADKRACIVTAVSTSLGMTTVTGAFHGYAVVSIGDA